MLSAACLSPAGVKFIDKMKFISHHEALKSRLDQADEFREMMLMETGFPASNFMDLSDVLNYLNTDGIAIARDEFFDLMLSLKAILNVKNYIAKRKDAYPNIAKLSRQVVFDANIVAVMEKIMDHKGDIKDNASPALFEIRAQMHRLTASMRNAIQKSLRTAKTNGWARDDAEVTIRNGRAVIPMLAADKRKIKGFIHDESNTGQLVYLEPMELFDTNNELRELEIAENQEILRILLNFSDSIRPDIEALLMAYRYLGMIDFVRAKANLAIKIGAIKPIINSNDEFKWREASHPLLMLSHAEKGKKVIPLDIALSAENRILIISGPNAGGKSVCLKTVGLLQYMLQCGLLVPMRENSEMRLFDDMFVNIGDEQSIENDLSTYSSHLVNIKKFLDKAKSNSLFLIDEFGAGTDPAIGGAIAEASLEKLNQKKSYGVVTTHYSNLKAMAKDGNGIVNGAMLFDTKELRPLYKLKIGKPGSSFAFEIARKIGLSEDILRSARHKSGRKEIDLDQRLQELEYEKELLEKKQSELEFTDDALKELVDKYESLNSKLQANKQQIIYDAKAEAKEILKDANRIIEKSVRDIKESKADSSKLKEVRKEVESKKQEINISLEKKVKKHKSVVVSTKEAATKTNVSVLEDNPEIGDDVRVIGQETVGTLEQIKGKNALVSFNSLMVSVKYAKLEKVRVKKIKRTGNANHFSGILKEIHNRSLNFNQNIDVRGMRAEEALIFVKNWIDEAILISSKDLEILHGTGNGILRQIIRDYLSSLREVDKFADAHIDFGGGGKTIIKMK